MAVEIKKDGYGQVEPNHLSAPRNGQVYAQLPANSSIETLENGMFVKYDYENGECNYTGDGPWFLVYNEEKLYDERLQGHKHFALKKADAYDGVIVPRVFAVVPGDIYTTNMVKDATYNKGDDLKVGVDGILAAGEQDKGPVAFKVVAETTLPDGQNAVKIQVIDRDASAGAGA